MEDLFGAQESRVVKTEWGEVTVYLSRSRSGAFYHLPRHLRDHSVPPHSINHRANLRALQKLGIRRVIATSAVGSISGRLRVGALGLLDQFIDLSTHHVTVFEDEPEHVDMTHPYDAGMQRTIGRSARSLGIKLVSGLTYVCVDGPRYETAAEIRMFSLIGGDVVGMTGAPEAIAARELGIGYASIVIATNKAAGLQARVSHDEVVTAMKRAKPAVKRLILAALDESSRL